MALPGLSDDTWAGDSVVMVRAWSTGKSRNPDWCGITVLEGEYHTEGTYGASV